MDSRNRLNPGRATMDKHDRKLFLEQMGDVRPLAPSDRIEEPARRAPSLSQLAQRDAALRTHLKDPNPLSLPEHVPEIGPLDIVGERKNGVQEGVYRKLRLGKYEVQDRLDLHRITLRDARVMVYEFLNSAFAQGLRTVMITHGKGQHSPTPGRLKSYVMHWLQEFDLVLAYHTAKPPHGGTGATYVLLRKSPEDRRRTRERFSD